MFGEHLVVRRSSPQLWFMSRAAARTSNVSKSISNASMARQWRNSAQLHVVAAIAVSVPLLAVLLLGVPVSRWWLRDHGASQQQHAACRPVVLE